MKAFHTGIGLVVGLMVGVPLLTLVATAYQMWDHGGVGLIRPTAVTVQTAPTPATPAPSASPASGANPAAPGGAAAPAAGTPAAPPQPPQPVPGRSAQDFTAHRPTWEAALKSADAKQGQQLAQAGKPGTGVQACVACHGQQGVAQPGGTFPTLAGLSADYLAKQLTDYRNGGRTQPLMNAIAKGLSPQEIGHLAKYYAGLPAPALASSAAGPEAARKLDVQGDNARALPACANCHGLGGRGEGALLPRLAGQPAQYFITQMNAFRNGQRHNDDVGVMQAFAQQLTPQEIEALANYYAQAAARQDAGQAGAAPAK
ncbi:MAG TPA: c-type cytochrome [Bordetella sp.]|nr:c-type cytochrome [Bordetella sp.]